MCIVLCISIACKGKSARVPLLCGKIWGRMTTRTRFDLSIYYICDLNPIQSFKCEERARESHDCITRSRARVRVVIRPPLRQQQQRWQNIHISARRRSPGLVNFFFFSCLPLLPGFVCSIHATWGHLLSEALSPMAAVSNCT